MTKLLFGTITLAVMLAAGCGDPDVPQEFMDNLEEAKASGDDMAVATAEAELDEAKLEATCKEHEVDFETKEHPHLYHSLHLSGIRVRDGKYTTGFGDGEIPDGYRDEAGFDRVGHIHNDGEWWIYPGAAWRLWLGDYLEARGCPRP